MAIVKPVFWNVQKGLVDLEWQRTWDGLSEAYLFREGGGVPLGLGGDVPVLDPNGGSVYPSWQRGPLGWEMHNPGGSAFIDLGPIPEMDDVVSCTIVIVAKWTQTATGNLFAIGNTASGSASYNLIANDTIAGDVEFSFRNDAETVNANISTGAIGLNDGKYHVIVAVQRGKSYRELIVDGVSYGTNTQDLGTITLNDALIFGRRRGGVLDADWTTGEMTFCWISSIGLPTQYIQRWSDDPFGPITLARRRFAKAAAVGGGLTIPIAAYHFNHHIAARSGCRR